MNDQSHDEFHSGNKLSPRHFSGEHALSDLHLQLSRDSDKNASCPNSSSERNIGG